MLTNRISQAIEIVRQGGVIVYTTDTVLGLGCDPHNHSATEKILWLKHRSVDKGLILLVASLDEMEKYSQPLSKSQYKKIISTLNNKPTTWLVPASKNTPPWITGKQNSVAIRISQHDITKELCSAVGAIVSTSANISEYPTIENEQQIRSWFGPYIDYVILGSPGTGQPSEICDVVTGKIIR